MSHFSSSKLEIYLLGTPQISRAGTASATLTSAKAQAILYYLAVTGRTQTRAALATLLWGEHGESEARSNLRKAIQQLREHFGDYLAIDQQTVGFRSTQLYWVDAVAFASQIVQVREANPAQLQQVIELYRDDFLDGFYVRDAPDFETWMLTERARLCELMLQALDTLAVRYADEGNLPQAIATMRRLLALEPWREESHRQLMIWLAQNGQRSAALAQYELCCRALAEELAVEPSQATRELYEQLLHQNSSDTTNQALSLTATEFTLVGRQPEWQTLRAAWHKVTQTGTHFVCIAGEAGIGKTRLAEELLTYAQRQGHATARSRAYALEGRLVYAPLADWLRAETLQGRLTKLNHVWLTEVARLLPELLIQQPHLPPPQPLTDRWQQKQLFEALRHAFTMDSRPLLLLLDDLQWCDPETLAWLQYLLEAASQVKLLVIGTVRNDEVSEDHPLAQASRNLLRAGKLTTIDLAPLNTEETVALGAQVTKHVIGSNIATRLYQETAGNPLFVIESVRAGVQGPGDNSVFRAQGAPAYSTLPPKVYTVIQSRLTQLSPQARALAQWTAIVGHAFNVNLLVQASQQAEETVVQGLDELWQRRIVCEQGNARYDFSHDRIRDVAYAEISPVKRALFHQRVAQALEKMYAQDLGPIAGELAAHYQQAGSLELALNYFRQAAEVAGQLYAHTERVEYLQKAIAVAETLPHSPAMAEIQADLWYELGATESILHDWSSEVVANAWQRSYELATQANNTVQQYRASEWLGSVARHRGQWGKASEFVDRAQALAQKTGDLGLIKQNLRQRGIMLYHLGNLTRALEHFKQGLHFLKAVVLLSHEEVDDPPSGNFSRLA